MLDFFKKKLPEPKKVSVNKHIHYPVKLSTYSTYSNRYSIQYTDMSKGSYTVDVNTGERIHNGTVMALCYTETCNDDTGRIKAEFIRDAINEKLEREMKVQNDA